MRAAGLDVRLEVEGEPVPLTPGVDLTAYRIVQEGLTNVLKHAGQTPARVLLRYTAGGLVVEVLNAAPDAPPGGASIRAGHGLLGMRERVGVYGGRRDAGVDPDGGYQLRATLPQ